MPCPIILTPSTIHLHLNSTNTVTSGTLHCTTAIIVEYWIHHINHLFKLKSSCKVQNLCGQSLSIMALFEMCTLCIEGHSIKFQTVAPHWTVPPYCRTWPQSKFNFCGWSFQSACIAIRVSTNLGEHKSGSAINTCGFIHGNPTGQMIHRSEFWDRSLQIWVAHL